ncbi:alpha/beta-hydrolase [Stipitochalara longipes BDJ]|nr:alpha/beta-hydrolase [Stipitochalara longipes BDJ]
MAPALPINNTEKVLLKTFQEVLGTSKAELGVETDLIQWGVTSLDIIKLKGHLQYELGLQNEIPLITILSNLTARSLSRALAEGAPFSKTYTPAVVLQSKGKKVPIWLFHPDNGEVLAFFGLARTITDRPVYTLRARGFCPNEAFFSSITEMISEYYKTMKAHQPHGPYALAGSELGSLLAFEVAKVLRANGDEVRFLGSFNSPPYNKSQAGQIDWSLCLLDLAVSLGLLSEQHRASVSQYFPALAKGEAVQHIQHASDPTRMAELCLTGDAIADWADVVFSLQKMAAGYQANGKVDGIDVFCGEPMTALPMDRKDWYREHLSSWERFGRDVIFHEVEGDTPGRIFGSESGATFQKTFSKVLLSRGL